MAYDSVIGGLSACVRIGGGGRRRGLTARHVHRAPALPPIRNHSPPENQRAFLRLLRRGHGSTRTCLLDRVPARRAVRILDSDAHLRQDDAVRGMLVRR